MGLKFIIHRLFSQFHHRKLKDKTRASAKREARGAGAEKANKASGYRAKENTKKRKAVSLGLV